MSIFIYLSIYALNLQPGSNRYESWDEMKPGDLVFAENTHVFQCMYVCMYVSMYICMYESIYLSIYLSVYQSIYLSIYIYIYVYLSIYICT
jgi:hypothetical protein